MVDGKMGDCEIHGATEVDYWGQCEICVGDAYKMMAARYAPGGDLYETISPYVGRHRAGEK